jgi:hypothetical protein
MTACEKCGEVLLKTERGNIRICTDRSYGFEHKVCPPVVATPVEQPEIPVMELEIIPEKYEPVVEEYVKQKEPEEED